MTIEPGYIYIKRKTDGALVSRFQFTQAGKKRARNKCDKLDNEYGSYNHSMIALSASSDIIHVF